jgi:hypothetical protein
MNFHDDYAEHASFGESPVYDLKLENELLKLKMQAEQGAQFGSFPGSPEMDPILERHFLESILAIEKAHAELTPVPVREHLGYPDFPLVAGLSEAGLEREWTRLQALYSERDLTVSFLAEYPVALMYEFLAFEFMEVEMEPFPGWCYIYEEFHPNHDYDIRERTSDFMREFFEGVFTEFTMSSTLLQSGRELSLPDAQVLLERFHGIFGRVESWLFEVDAIDVRYAPTEPRAPWPDAGCASGSLHYSCRATDGVRNDVEGPFRLELECVHGCWSVCGFEVAGFVW